jgi:hypothetical protein
MGRLRLPKPTPLVERDRHGHTEMHARFDYPFTTETPVISR